MNIARWCWDYIHTNYGSRDELPGWYDRGGWLPPGPSPDLVDQFADPHLTGTERGPGPPPPPPVMNV